MRSVEGEILDWLKETYPTCPVIRRNNIYLDDSYNHSPICKDNHIFVSNNIYTKLDGVTTYSSTEYEFSSPEPNESRKNIATTKSILSEPCSSNEDNKDINYQGTTEYLRIKTELMTNKFQDHLTFDGVENTESREGSHTYSDKVILKNLENIQTNHSCSHIISDIQKNTYNSENFITFHDDYSNISENNCDYNTTKLGFKSDYNDSQDQSISSGNDENSRSYCNLKINKKKCITISPTVDYKYIQDISINSGNSSLNQTEVFQHTYSENITTDLSVENKVVDVTHNDYRNDFPSTNFEAQNETTSTPDLFSSNHCILLHTNLYNEQARFSNSENYNYYNQSTEYTQTNEMSNTQDNYNTYYNDFISHSIHTSSDRYDSSYHKDINQVEYTGSYQYTGNQQDFSDEFNTSIPSVGTIKSKLLLDSRFHFNKTYNTLKELLAYFADSLFGDKSQYIQPHLDQAEHSGYLSEGFTFLDLGCAPGGFSQCLLDLPHQIAPSYGVGVTLPSDENSPMDVRRVEPRVEAEFLTLEGWSKKKTASELPSNFDAIEHNIDWFELVHDLETMCEMNGILFNNSDTEEIFHSSSNTFVENYTNENNIEYDSETNSNKQYQTTVDIDNTESLRIPNIESIDSLFKYDSQDGEKCPADNHSDIYDSKAVSNINETSYDQLKHIQLQSQLDTQILAMNNNLVLLDTLIEGVNSTTEMYNSVTTMAEQILKDLYAFRGKEYIPSNTKNDRCYQWIEPVFSQSDEYKPASGGFPLMIRCTDRYRVIYSDLLDIATHPHTFGCEFNLVIADSQLLGQQRPQGLAGRPEYIPLFRLLIVQITIAMFNLCDRGVFLFRYGWHGHNDEPNWYRYSTYGLFGFLWDFFDDIEVFKSARYQGGDHSCYIMAMGFQKRKWLSEQNVIDSKENLFSDECKSKIVEVLRPTSDDIQKLKLQRYYDLCYNSLGMPLFTIRSLRGQKKLQWNYGELHATQNEVPWPNEEIIKFINDINCDWIGRTSHIIHSVLRSSYFSRLTQRDLRNRAFKLCTRRSGIAASDFLTVEDSLALQFFVCKYTNLYDIFRTARITIPKERSPKLYVDFAVKESVANRTRHLYATQSRKKAKYFGSSLSKGYTGKAPIFLTKPILVKNSYQSYSSEDETSDNSPCQVNIHNSYLPNYRHESSNIINQNNIFECSNLSQAGSPRLSSYQFSCKHSFDHILFDKEKSMISPIRIIEKKEIQNNDTRNNTCSEAEYISSANDPGLKESTRGTQNQDIISEESRSGSTEAMYLNSYKDADIETLTQFESSIQTENQIIFNESLDKGLLAYKDSVPEKVRIPSVPFIRPQNLQGFNYPDLKSIINKTNLDQSKDIICHENSEIIECTMNKSALDNDQNLESDNSGQNNISVNILEETKILNKNCNVIEKKDSVEEIPIDNIKLDYIDITDKSYIQEFNSIPSKYDNAVKLYMDYIDTFDPPIPAELTTPYLLQLSLLQISLLSNACVQENISGPGFLLTRHSAITNSTSDNFSPALERFGVPNTLVYGTPVIPKYLDDLLIYQMRENINGKSSSEIPYWINTQKTEKYIDPLVLFKYKYQPAFGFEHDNVVTANDNRIIKISARYEELLRDKSVENNEGLEGLTDFIEYGEPAPLSYQFSEVDIVSLPFLQSRTRLKDTKALLSKIDEHRNTFLSCRRYQREADSSGITVRKTLSYPVERSLFIVFQEDGMPQKSLAEMELKLESEGAPASTILTEGAVQLWTEENNTDTYIDSNGLYNIWNKHITMINETMMSNSDVTDIWLSKGETDHCNPPLTLLAWELHYSSVAEFFSAMRIAELELKNSCSFYFIGVKKQWINQWSKVGTCAFVIKNRIFSNL